MRKLRWLSAPIENVDRDIDDLNEALKRLGITDESQIISVNVGAHPDRHSTYLLTVAYWSER